MIGVICPYCDNFLNNKDGLDHLDEEIEKVNLRITSFHTSQQFQHYVNALTVLLARRHILDNSLKKQDEQND